MRELRCGLGLSTNEKPGFLLVVSDLNFVVIEIHQRNFKSFLQPGFVR